MEKLLKKILTLFVLTCLGISSLYSDDLHIVKSVRNNTTSMPFVTILFFLCIVLLLILIIVIVKYYYLNSYKKLLLLNEEKYKNLLDSLSDIAFKTDETGCISYCNKAAEMATQLSSKELLYKTFLPLFKEESQKRAADAFKKVINGQSVIIELTFCTGKIFQYNCRPEKNDRGEVIGTFGIGRDITENKKTVQELSNTKELLESTLDVIPDVIGIQDNEHNIIKYNTAGYALLNKTHGDVVGKKCYELIGRSSPCEICATSKCYKTKKPEKIIKFVEEINAWLDIRAYPILDSKGNIKMVVEHLRDITEYKNKGTMLQKTEAHLSSLLEALPDLVWLKDKDGVYITCNPRFEDFFGAKRCDIVGKTDYDFVDKELADFFRERDKAAMLANKPTINEELITFACDGHKEKLETIKTPMYNEEGELLGVLGVGRDITERKEMAGKLREVNEELEDAQKHAVYMLALASEYKDQDTGAHIKRIAHMTTKLALQVGFNVKDAEKMGQNSILHDLGKLGISDYILLKPKKLTQSESEIMKQHTHIGADIIGDTLWFREARDIALYHHENWDGTGYPEGLKEEKIPLSARIVSVVDAFDALISNRPYKSAWKLEEAVGEIKKEAGKKFDPKIVDAFMVLFNNGTISKLFEDMVNENSGQS